MATTNEPIIKEVWTENLDEEMMNISNLLEKYPYIAMDTEFPGIIHYTGKSNYKNIKANVDDLRLIQCGISLSDEKGNSPPNCSTWQFNLKFDLNKDKSSSESISLLIKSGIEFDKLITNGISQDTFGESLITSGLILNEDIKWVSFHGSYDFAYLLKVIRNLPLPDTENDFFNEMKLYFPCFYDIRHLTRGIEGLSKSLQKLAQDLEVSRYGTQHQAGSDAMLTLQVFHKLNFHYQLGDSLKNDENILFGIGQYYEDESALIFDGINQNTYFGSNTSQSFIPHKAVSNNYDINSYFTQNQNIPFSNNSQQFNKPSNHSFNYSSIPYTGGYGVDYLINNPAVAGMNGNNINRGDMDIKNR